MDSGARLAIDFGTAHTVAVVRRDGREPRLLLFDGSPLLPSAVCADADGRLLTGRDALHAGAATPGAFEPHPKRCIDDRTVLLGEHEIAVTDLIGAVLRRVADEATSVLGGLAVDVVVTCPAAWGATRQATLLAAAEALWPRVRLLPEPVAAAHHFVAVTGARASTALVYDFGAGTFDASVVRRTATGHEVLASEGLPDCGGLDIDAAIVAYLGTIVAGRSPETWARLNLPATAADQRHRRQLWDGVRTAKEVLSRATSTYVHVPLLDTDEILGREQFDALAAPVIERTLGACRAALRTAGVTPEAIYLTGGSSRIPAVVTALHQRFGIVPQLIDQPETAVAEGAAGSAAAGGGVDSRGPGAGGSISAGAITGGVVPGGAGVRNGAGADAAAGLDVREPGAREPSVREPSLREPSLREPGARERRAGWSRFAVLGVASVVVAALIAAGVVWAVAGRDDPGSDTPSSLRAAAGRTPPPSAASTATPQTSPTPSLAPGLDACLIGTWSLGKSRAQLTIEGTTVEFTGTGGQKASYGPDGTVRVEFTDAPLRGTYQGANWTRYSTGSVTARYRVSGGTLIYSDLKATGTWWYMRNGIRQNSGDLAIDTAPERYVCSGDAMTLGGSALYAQEFTRTS